MKIKRILIPVDFSPSSLEALDFAVALAQPFKAELLLLSVIEPVLYVVPDYGGAQSSALAESMNQQRQSAQIELVRLERACRKRGLKVRTLLQIGAPARLIVDTAAKTKADLIVMATHGRTGVSRLLMGSVAERVVRTASCPVLTFHGRGRASASRGRGRRKRIGA